MKPTTNPPPPKRLTLVQTPYEITLGSPDSVTGIIRGVISCRVWLEMRDDSGKAVAE
jgi:hypothetical protein